MTIEVDRFRSVEDHPAIVDPHWRGLLARLPVADPAARPGANQLLHGLRA